MKFSIVTPTFNSERFLRETIESVLAQKGDFEVEYLIMDGRSTDRTLEIARSYECRGAVTVQVFSERDGGMYDAINRGFNRVSGDVLAWINSDDFYLPGAFEAIRRSFEANPDVSWLKGITAYTDPTSSVVELGRCYLYDQKWIQAGVYGREAHFIQQDSVFWRKKLWEMSGPIDSSLRLAGDYSLWTRFAKASPLVSLNQPVSCFRRVDGQLSGDVRGYMVEQLAVSPWPGLLGTIRKCYFGTFRRLPAWLSRLSYRVFFGGQNLWVIDPKQAGGYQMRRGFHFIYE